MENQKEVYLSIYNEYRDKILRLCFAYLDDTSYAEDIFLFNKQERKRKPEQISDSVIDSSVNEMDQKIREEKKLDQLYRAIASLGEYDRMLIGLYLERLKYEEIASILGISTSHVGVKISRIKKSIQKHLNQ